MSFSLVFDDLCGKFTFHDDGLADEDEAVHRGDAVTNGRHELDAENQSVARHDFLSELHLVQTEEVGAPTEFKTRSPPA